MLRTPPNDNRPANVLQTPLRPPRTGLWAGFVLCGLLSACSPTLNWRVVDVGPQTRVQFPCKPEHAERALMLAGAPARAAMWACEAGGISWSATLLDVKDPAQLGEVLRESRLSLARRLQGSEESGQPVQLNGMTPNPEARRVVILGPAGDGQPARAEAVFVTRGLQVFQLVAMAQRGRPADWAESADEFLRSLRWPS
jgi:hypothetical protein